MTCAEDEDALFTAIARSTRLHVLIWSNCSPFAEAGVNVLDMRPLLSVLGDNHPSLAHLDLSGARLDIPSNRRALITKLPKLHSLRRLELRHVSLVLRGVEAGDTQQSSADCGPRELMQTIVELCNLQELDLSGNIISLEGCGILETCAENGFLAELQSLKLRSAQLDDTCALRLSRMLAHLKGCSPDRSKAY